MTRELLKQYPSILQELQEIDKKIRKTQDEINKLSAEGTVVDSVSGGSGGTQHFRIEGMPSKSIQLKRAHLNSLQMRKSYMELQKQEVEIFLNELDDYRMRRIIRYRFFEGLHWQEVADKMGGNCTENSVKKEFERFYKAVF